MTNDDFPNVDLSRLAALEADWGGDGEFPVDPRAIERARLLLSYLCVVPSGEDGGLQIEWHTNEFDWFVYVDPDGSVEAVTEASEEAS